MKNVCTEPKSDKREYLDFSPAVTNQEKLKDKENFRNSLFTLLEKDISSSCFILSLKSKITKNPSIEPKTSPVEPPETVKKLSNRYPYIMNQILFCIMWLNLPDHQMF